MGGKPVKDRPGKSNSIPIETGLFSRLSKSRLTIPFFSPLGEKDEVTAPPG
jgi:hypothetical protein